MHNNFEQYLKENPLDWQARLAYSDYLEEDNKIEKANSQRFLSSFIKNAKIFKYKDQEVWPDDSTIFVMANDKKELLILTNKNSYYFYKEGHITLKRCYKFVENGDWEEVYV